MVAARMAVSAPTTATTIDVRGVSWYRADERATMYTPAVTMVAAWIRAETGVGPSIASGSQMYSGICADLPVAPMKSSSVIHDTVPNTVSGLTVEAARATSWKSTVPKRTNS